MSHSPDISATVAATTDTSPRRKSSTKTSFFTRARQSFLRNGGSHGACVETLRGTKGASFEGPGTITRGGSPAVGCGGCFGGGGRFEPKQRFLLVKGQYCFVYAKESDPSPKYAVGLQGLRATKLKPTTSGVGRGGDGSAVTVRLENSLGDVQYEVALANEALARTFQAAVEKHAASAEVEAVRKNLGHEALVGKRSSVVYADAVGKEKVSAQPDAPLSATEIMANMPSPGQI